VFVRNQSKQNETKQQIKKKKKKRGRNRNISRRKQKIKQRATFVLNTVLFKLSQTTTTFAVFLGASSICSN
jgi:hypothetical protein